MDIVLRSILRFFERGIGTIKSQRGHPPVSFVSESSFAKGENNFSFLNQFYRFGGHEQISRGCDEDDDGGFSRLLRRRSMMQISWSWSVMGKKVVTMENGSSWSETIK
ncbi:hypothetical protein NE237_027913 [Protea cynaroides]|uniref:Uncharacterized protein n=1 Tax=Protea cynaroides TaxID=273540 RepID=A0A9Q0GNF0_9MAGN|nr:hypothetical protein NE237_027913 [Protea cynaroides]